MGIDLAEHIPTILHKSGGKSESSQSSVLKLIVWLIPIMVAELKFGSADGTSSETGEQQSVPTELPDAGGKSY